MSDKALLIKLRKQTGAGIMDIKEALEEAGGNEEKALELLRKKGQKMMAKRANRETSEGWIGSYVHTTGKVAAQVGLLCETDFVARNPEFQALAKDLAMQVVASNPDYISPKDIPDEVIAKEKEVYNEEIKKAGDKPAEVIEKILNGKLEKFYDEVCLTRQYCVKDDTKTIQNLLEEATAKIGEKIEIGEFNRIQL